MHYNFSFDKNRIRLLFMSLTSLMTLFFFLGWIVGGMMPIPGSFNQPTAASREEDLGLTLSYTPTAIAKTYPETTLPIEPEKPKAIPRKAAVKSQAKKGNSKGRIIIAQSAHQRYRKAEKKEVLLHLAEIGPENWKFEQSVDKACSNEVFYSILIGSFENEEGITDLLNNLKIKAVKEDELLKKSKKGVTRELTEREAGDKLYVRKASSKYETSGREKETWHNVLIGKYKDENEAFEKLGQFTEEDQKTMMMAAVTSISKLSDFSVLTGAFLKEEKAKEKAEALKRKMRKIVKAEALKGKIEKVVKIEEELLDSLKNNGEEPDKEVKNWFVHIGNSENRIGLDSAQKISEMEKGKAFIISENYLSEACKQEHNIKTRQEAIEALKIYPDVPKPRLPYTIQLASYYSEKKANEGLGKLKKKGLTAVYIAETSNGRWAACMGQYETRKEAKKAHKKNLRKINKGIAPRSDSLVRKTPESYTGGSKMSYQFQRSERMEYFSNFISPECKACFASINITPDSV